jgi:hypothetical protein
MSDMFTPVSKEEEARVLASTQRKSKSKFDINERTITNWFNFTDQRNFDLPCAVPEHEDNLAKHPDLYQGREQATLNIGGIDCCRTCFYEGYGVEDAIDNN